jgi:hypothetical protein
MGEVVSPLKSLVATYVADIRRKVEKISASRLLLPCLRTLRPPNPNEPRKERTGEFWPGSVTPPR